MDKKVGIIGAGVGGIYCAYELVHNGFTGKIVIYEAGNDLTQRSTCPISLGKTDKCVNCKYCSIMSGFGGAGAFSDGKYNITNDFGGTLYNVVGKETALDLMKYVDKINMSYLTDCGKYFPIWYTNDKIGKVCLQNNLHLLNNMVRHIGTDMNHVMLSGIRQTLIESGVEFRFNTRVESFSQSITHDTRNYVVLTDKGDVDTVDYLVVSTGRVGSAWVNEMCNYLGIKTFSRDVDIGVRVELPYDVWSHITDEVYEGKIVYRTKTYQDNVRTFCMNPHGEVVLENTHGIITVNGHSYHDEEDGTENTNFALLVSNHFTEPFNNSTEYGESIAKLSNMLGGGVIVQRFGDLIRGQRSTQSRIDKGFVKPTLSATAGDLSLVLPKRILDDIIEMIYALDKIAQGTASDDTLLYGVEVKFYNTIIDNNIPNLFFVGDCSGFTHSLSQASAHGVYVAREIFKK